MYLYALDDRDCYVMACICMPLMTRDCYVMLFMFCFIQMQLQLTWMFTLYLAHCQWAESGTQRVQRFKALETGFLNSMSSNLWLSVATPNRNLITRTWLVTNSLHVGSMEQCKLCGRYTVTSQVTQAVFSLYLIMFTSNIHVRFQLVYIF